MLIDLLESSKAIGLCPMGIFQMYTSIQFHIASKYTKLSTYQVRKKPVHAKRPSDNKIV